MQNDLALNDPDLAIQILGVNDRGYEGGNGSVTMGRDIPWLQDVDADLDGYSDVWTSWNPEWRDVVILDAANNKLAVFNLSYHDLQSPQEYASLRQLLVDAATVPEPSTLALLATAAVGLLVYARRRRPHIAATGGRAHGTVTTEPSLQDRRHKSATSGRGFGIPERCRKSGQIREKRLPVASGFTLPPAGPTATRGKTGHPAGP